MITSGSEDNNIPNNINSLRNFSNHARCGDGDDDDKPRSGGCGTSCDGGDTPGVTKREVFFINLMADGVTFSYGVFLPIIQKEFGTSKSTTTTWAGSLLASMPLLSGPIASTLTDRYGCRNCTIVGGILATLGFILSYYAISIHMLILAFGVITGFGLSLCYVAAVVIVAYYFDKRRSLAPGLSMCGGGIGTFISDQLESDLVGGRRVFLFSLCFCAILMKDLEWSKKSSRKREKVLQNEHDLNTQTQLNLYPTFVREAEQLCLKNNNSASHYVKNGGGGGKGIRYYSNNYAGGFTSGGGPILVPAPVPPRAENNDLSNEDKSESGGQDSVDDEGGQAIIKDDKMMMMMEENESDSPLLVVAVANNNNNSNNYGSNNQSSNKTNGKGEVTSSPSPSPNNEKNGVNSSCNGGAGNMSTLEKQGMRNNLVQHTRYELEESSQFVNVSVLNLKRSRMRPFRPATSCPDIISVATADDNTPEWKAALQDIYVWMQEIFALDHLKNTRFVLFIMSNFLLYMWYEIPLTFLADTATGLGYSEGEGAMLGSTIGLLTVFGNIILGYLGDKKWANSVTIYGLCISICGIVTGLMPCLFGKLFSMGLTYYFLVLLCGVFGLMIAANYSLTPVIVLQASCTTTRESTPGHFGSLGVESSSPTFSFPALIYQRHQARYEESTWDISASRSSGRSSSSSCEEGRVQIMAIVVSDATTPAARTFILQYKEAGAGVINNGTAETKISNNNSS
ncbi:Monocarboxylate transporter 14 [Folsomia candida]|uniref:Monocarboxylate transporter 14 n=1 Tax=Folsomia candida TaxID=158441 RepID=A0A226DNS2_FOLCA|nr:Monocarboxylate transporter 14 [Folsomia candida]